VPHIGADTQVPIPSGVIDAPLFQDDPTFPDLAPDDARGLFQARARTFASRPGTDKRDGGSPRPPKPGVNNRNPGRATKRDRA